MTTKFGSLYRTLLISLAIPLVFVQVLLHRNVAPVLALGLSAIFPLGEMTYEAIATRRVGLVAVISLVGIAIGTALSFATGDARFALVRESFFTFAFGTIFLGSLATSRPLIFRLNLDLAGADVTARAEAERLWEFPRARRVFRTMTAVWGIGLLVEASARVVVALTLAVPVAAAASPGIAIVVFGGLIVWTAAYARAARRERADASAPQPR